MNFILSISLLLFDLGTEYAYISVIFFDVTNAIGLLRNFVDL